MRFLNWIESKTGLGKNGLILWGMGLIIWLLILLLHQQLADMNLSSSITGCLGIFLLWPLLPVILFVGLTVHNILTAEGFISYEKRLALAAKITHVVLLIFIFGVIMAIFPTLEGKEVTPGGLKLSYVFLGFFIVSAVLLAFWYYNEGAGIRKWRDKIAPFLGSVGFSLVDDVFTGKYKGKQLMLWVHGRSQKVGRNKTVPWTSLAIIAKNTRMENAFGDSEVKVGKKEIVAEIRLEDGSFEMDIMRGLELVTK